MTIKEANQFYSTDKKEYDIRNNIEFIDWLNELVKNGYSQYLSFDDMEDLINNLPKLEEQLLKTQYLAIKEAK